LVLKALKTLDDLTPIGVKDELYRTTHKSFKSYCFEKWGISEAYATRNIKAFEINENIKDLPIGKGLLTESQLRPLTNLSLIHL